MAFRKGYSFHGIHRNTPDVYSYVTSNMKVEKTNGALKMALIGNSLGGKPGEIIFIDDPEIAKETLKGGDLLDAALRAYDPVSNTKDGVELGGADLILAIRANNATRSKSEVYQAKEVPATIQDVVSTKHPNSTGKVKLTEGAEYTGEENKTYKIVITSEGTKDLVEASFDYMLASDGEVINDKPLLLSQAQNTTGFELGDGVKVDFEEGKYTEGDSFLIAATAPVTTTEFVYTIESRDYGKLNNYIQHKLEEGTDPGTKKLTIYDSKNDEYEVLDNLGSAFEIKYTGDEKYASLTIVPDGKGNSIKLQTLIGESEEAAVIDLDFDLNQSEFRSIKALAQEISAYENYEVTLAPVINPTLTVNDFDFVEKEDIKEKEFHISAVLEDIKKGTKDNSRLVEVNIINREVSNFNDYEFTNLKGGSEGKDPLSYDKFLKEIAKHDVDYVVPLTSDLPILAETRQHVIDLSTREGKERRMVAGLGNQTAVGNAINIAQRLASDRVQLIGTGMWDYDENREPKLYPAYILAAQHAGRAAFLKEESATNDTYKMIEPEKTFEGKDRRDLINNGVMFFDQVVSDVNYSQFYSNLVWDYTTFTDYNDPIYVERSTGAITDMISKEGRKVLRKILVGKLTPTSVMETAKQAIISMLQEKKKQGVINAFKNIKLSKHADVVNITMDIAPAEVTNFVFVDFNYYRQDIVVEG